jgi:uncharacterized protein (UPF0303 family)
MPSTAFPTAAAIAEQTADLIFPSFDEMDAQALGQSLTDMALDAQLGVVINIRTENRTLYHAALPGSAPLNEAWARRKSNVALMFGKSSLEVGCKHREADTDLTRDGLNPADYASHGGAIPVVVAGVGVVAVVTVSGLPQLDDHAMVVAAMQTHLARSE